MSEPPTPSIVSAYAITLSPTKRSPSLTRKQPCLEIFEGIKRSRFYNCAAEIAVGSFCDFPFEIEIDSWIDRATGLHYFKPCGRTFGPLKSQADFAYDGFEDLFHVLHGNENLQMYDSEVYEKDKTTADADWASLCCLALPSASGLTAISSGTSEDFTWLVGTVAGTSQYTLKLPHHNHKIQQIAHTHTFNQESHLHLVEGSTYDTNASELGGGSGSADKPVGNSTMTSNINIQLEEYLTNVSVLASGTISDRIKVQNSGIGMQKMIFSGVIDV